MKEVQKKNIIQKVRYVYETRGLGMMCRTVMREVWGIVLSKIVHRRVVRARIFDFVMFLDLKDKGISRALWLFGVRELDHKWIMEKTLPTGSTVLDIGANIGYYALIERSLVGDSGRIIAVEPSPDNLNLLRRNMNENRVSNVEIVEGAVSNIAGVEKFWLAEESNLNSFHPEGLRRAGSLKGSIEVQVRTVCDLAKEFGRIDYLRMDVEGHEVQILKDICKLVKSGLAQPDIIFEPHINTYDEATQNIEIVLHEMYELGYRAKYVASSSARGTAILEQLGSSVITHIRTDEVVRTIHEDLNIEHLIGCLTKTGGIRTVFLTAGT